MPCILCMSQDTCMTVQADSTTMRCRLWQMPPSRQPYQTLQNLAPVLLPLLLVSPRRLMLIISDSTASRTMCICAYTYTGFATCCAHRCSMMLQA